MKKILVLGAGRTATSLIEYLINEARDNDWFITVGDFSPELAAEKTGGAERAKAIRFDINDGELRKREISAADVVISYLPYNLHSLAARECLNCSTHLITASYLSASMMELDREARRKGLVFLNEMGLDPGIDHMDVMSLLSKIKSEGGMPVSIKSSCGGLIAPESDNNCWGYKFTWSPMNVVLAGQNNAKYIKNSQTRFVPYNKLFLETDSVNIPGHGNFESYPNRDSLPYLIQYGVKGVRDFYRGTLRRPGYAAAWNALIKMGLTNNERSFENLAGMTYREWVRALNPALKGDDPKTELSEFLELPPDSDIINKILWLDLFRDEKIGLASATSAGILLRLLEEKWNFEEDGHDLVILRTEIEYETGKDKKKITSTMTCTGKDKIHTAMTLTGGLPAGIGAKLILNRTVKERGVIIPVHTDIYEPVLEELKSLGISFSEEERQISAA